MRHNDGLAQKFGSPAGLPLVSSEEKKNPHAATWGMHKNGDDFMQFNYNPSFDQDAWHSDYIEFEALDGLLQSLHKSGIIDSQQLENERRSSGLSTVHIRRKRDQKFGIKNRKYVPWQHRTSELKTGQREGELIVWQDGSLVQVKRAMSWEIEEIGGKRGKISGFSDASRRRMMRKIAKMERASKPLWFDLTYPDEFYSDRYNGKRLKEDHLKKFFQRLEYLYPNAGFIWKLEYQSRKSGLHVGKFFPHFHMLVWGLKDVDLYKLQKKVAVIWWEVCGKLSENHLKAGTSVERIRSPRGVFWYASKYMTKTVEDMREFDQDAQAVGRWWGVKGNDNLPFSVCEVITTYDDEQLQKIIRFMAAYAGYSEDAQAADWKGLSIFCDAGKFYYQGLDKLLIKGV